MTLHVEGFHSFTDVSLDPAGKVREVATSHEASLSHLAESKVLIAVKDDLEAPEALAHLRRWRRLESRPATQKVYTVRL